jgi:ribonucleoside-diphosphate reductase alpha chain
MERERYAWLNENSRKFLSRGYLDVEPEERIKEIANEAQKLLRVKGFAEKFEDYMSKGYYSLATPVWTNFGKGGKLPISCYGSTCDDTLDSILNVGREIGMMSKYGGGTSLYLGNIRPRGSEISTGGHADGPVHYSHIYDTIIDKCSQGQSRRGACALYLDVEHPDIMDFLDIGTEGNPIQNLQFGVNVTDKWINEMIEGDMDKRSVWSKVLQRRSEFGFPYIFFTDNVNNNTPYKKLGGKITHSNLCTEILLPDNLKESFVCCIGSINLLYWDEIEKTDAVETYVLFLNAVLNDFIKKSRGLPGMKRAWRFAKDHRAIGVGVLGYHSYLQSKLIPFESLQAKATNEKIFSEISKRANKASRWCNKELGFESIRPGYANSTLMAIAPTKSSSYILEQVSMGIEPLKSNYFVKDLAKVKSVYKNPYLESELEKYGLNTIEVWKEILDKDGSCQHLDFPTKEVFKSFIEISPMEIIQQAAQRQKYIDQGQSVNLMIHPSIPAKEINQLYLEAWRMGLKTLYYQFSQSAAQSFAREINQCASCEA